MNIEREFNIWADGSYYSDTQTAGAGWVVADLEGNIIKTGYERLTKEIVRNSTEAEIMAATLAMNSLDGDCVHMLCGDNEEVLNMIRQGVVLSRSNGNQGLFDLCANLIYARGEKPSAAIEYRSDEKSPLMKAAHDLSRKASFQLCYA